MNTTLDAEIYLDLRGLQPPEPMERVLDELERLKARQQVRLLIDREPLPLYRLLERNGYLYHKVSREPGLYELVIKRPR